MTAPTNPVRAPLPPLARPPLVQRRDAAQATHDAFKGKPFAWGSADCVRVAAYHLRRLGYRPNLVRGGTYSTEVAAVRALRRAGFKSIEAALTATGLVEIGYASALVGDLYALRSAGKWPALAVYLGNGVVLTSSEELGVWWPARPAHDKILSCWRADPCPRR